MISHSKKGIHSKIVTGKEHLSVTIFFLSLFFTKIIYRSASGGSMAICVSARQHARVSQNMCETDMFFPIRPHLPKTIIQIKRRIVYCCYSTQHNVLWHTYMTHAHLISPSFAGSDTLQSDLVFLP